VAEQGDQADRRPGQIAYRSAFIAGLVLFAAVFASGVGYAVATKGRLPEVGAHPLTQAAELLERGEVARAAQQYRIASRIDRGDTAAAKRAAELQQSLGDKGGELEYYLRQRDLQPSNAATHRNLAQVLFNHRRFDESMAAYQKAISLDAGDARAYAGVGEILLEQDRLPEAGQAFRDALARDPNNAATHNSLGIVTALSGRPGDAVAHFEQAVRLKPGSFEANLQRARAEAAAAVTR
jgi:tetratricopeptide (TPR) repeat protein